MTDNNCPTTNPIEQDDSLLQYNITLNAFAYWESIPDAITNKVIKDKYPVKLTGRKSFWYAGAGYAYEIEIDNNTYWVKGQSIKKLRNRKDKQHDRR